MIGRANVQWWRRTSVITALLALGVVSPVVAAAIPTAAANRQAACEGRTLSQPLRTWGDTRDYFLANGADFERQSVSSEGWTTSGGAGRVDENEPGRVAESRHGRSIGVPQGGRLSNAGICLFSNEESLRFFAKSPGGSGRLTVSVTVAGSTTTQVLGSLAAGWSLSPSIAVPRVTAPAGSYATISFVGTGAGRWLVDDVLIDPRKGSCC